MKELTTEQRLLLALVLSVVVVTLSDLLVFRRYKPAEQHKTPSTVIQTPAKPASPAGATVSAPAVKAAAPAIAAAKEQIVVVESGLYRIELSNRGGVVRSWQLLSYHDESKPPKILDVVHPPSNLESEEWPLSFLMVDPKLQAEANGALFQVEPRAGTIRAPATVVFTWSDGHLSIRKEIRFLSGYVAEVECSVTFDGQPVVYALAWRGGFGDETVERAADRVAVFYSNGSKLEKLGSKKLGSSSDAEVPASVPGPLAFAGIEDGYFAAAFLPATAGAPLSAWDWRTERPAPGEKAGTTEQVAEVAVGPPEGAPGPVALRLYVGPKSLAVLGSVDTRLRSLVDFGIMSFIAEPLFYVLQYEHGYIPNWGWAIVVLTIVLNMLLFPLKVTSWRAMQKMQKLMPEMKAIQGRYKKYPMRDPRRQKMNEELMELYKREGANPWGSCLPMLLQMPIWWALFEMLETSIELRHAPWILWIHDLSVRDPYYILPGLMIVAGYVMQKMTPMTSPDPNQQKMMNLMPVLFGFLFMTLSSGLILYIVTSYMVGIGQQWVLNKTSPVTAGAGKRPKKQGGT